MRGFLFLFGCVFVVGACVAQNRQPFAGTLPQNTSLDMTGTFTLSPDGELHLALANPCTVEHATLAVSAVSQVPCGPVYLKNIQVIAHTPWNQDIRGTWDDAAHVAFRIDWTHSGLDPLMDDVRTVVGRPWGVSGTYWNPTTAESALILKLVADATETETEVVHGGPVPNLEVTTFEVDGGTLHVGDASTLVVQISNRGPGTAYRVVATTRASIDALQGRRLSFGAIKPGAAKVRRMPFTVPVSETAPDTMIVLVLTEGNGVAPRNVSRRISIAPSAVAPKLAMRCTILGHDVPRPDLDAGENLSVRCVVDNTGDAAAKAVDLETSIAGGTPVRTQPQPIALAGRAVFDVPLTIPRELPIDAPVEIATTARDRQYSRTVSTKLSGVVRKPKLCVPGKLTRAQYRAKLAELRAAVTAGDLTQAQLDRYDAELVTCLK